jgi:ABC-type Fe3+/spermidine/putrescine transport system ATPase subunit
MQSQTPGHIEAENVVVQYGDVTAVRGISFAIEPGKQLTLLGPSGCGKTTMLRAIAGLEQPTGGEIRIGGTPVYSSAKRVNVPAEKRGLSMVFQSYAIWPHMTVFDNVAYGLRVRKKSATETQDLVRKALDLVQMRPFEERRASALSGGQQQRVALARAFVFQPSVLLFDEPLSNLDAKLRADMRIELRELQHRLGITSLYVTHDLEEALAMSDRIIVMRNGTIEQSGSPDEIYNRPRNAFVADFVGSANLVRGKPRPELARNGSVVLELASGEIMHGISAGRVMPADPCLSVRTVHLRLFSQRPPGEVNVWPVRVRRLVFQGDFTQAFVTLGGQDLVVRSTAMEGISEGQDAFLTVDPNRCVLLEP